MTGDESDPEVVIVGGNADDDVDLLISAWSDVLPGVDLTPLDVMSRLRRVARRLDAARADAFASAGLVIWEFDVLAALRRAGADAALSPGSLATATGTSSAGVTHRIDRLTERGLTRREVHPTDGRSVLVSLTETGAIAVDAAMTELVRREATMLAVFASSERDALERSLRRLSAR